MATKTWAISIDAVGAWDGSASIGGNCSHLPVGYLGWLGGASRAFLKFSLDWAGVVQITSAVLHIRTNSPYHGMIGGSNTNNVDLVTGSWSEGASGETWLYGASPSYSTAVSTSYRATFQARSASAWFTCDITAIANRWAPSSVKQSGGAAGAGASNYGIRLSASNEGSAAYGTEFYSSEGGTSDAYITLTYSTNQAPVVDSLDSPVGGVTITDDTPDLAAHLHDPDASGTVSAYDIQVSTVANFASTVISLANQAIGVPAQSVVVTHTATALSRGATYYWRMAGRDNLGALGAWSAAGQFYLATQPTLDQQAPTAGAYPTIHNLAETALWTDGAFAKPRLSWRYNSTSGLAMAQFRVRVYDAATAGSLVADSGVVNQSAASGATVTHDLVTAMPRATSRWWTVEAWDTAGGDSTESARQQFSVQWGQALYEANPGAGSSAWVMTLGAVAGGSVVALYRTATQSGSAGAFGTTSSWAANIGDLAVAAWVNVLVRLAPTTPGVNPTLASMTLQYLASSSTPDHWTTVPTGEWALSTAQRRFGAKSLKCSVAAATAGNRYAYPFRNGTGDDLPVIPGVKYTLSAYVNTPVALTGGTLSVKVYQGGSLTTEVPAQYVTKASEVVTTTVGEPDGWKRLSITFTAPPGWTAIRPMAHYLRTSGVTEAFYLDGVKLEEGPVATPWQAGALGAVILDSGGIVVDGMGGGTFRLRGSNGGRALVELGTSGLVVGGDTPLVSPVARAVDIQGVGGANPNAGAEVEYARWGVETAATDLAHLAAVQPTGRNTDSADLVLRARHGGSLVEMIRANPATGMVAFPAGMVPVMRVYTAGATWNKPAGLVAIQVEAMAGGGAGGGATAAASGGHSKGAGGGAGGYSRSLILAGSLAASYTVTVGAGGTGVSAAAGNPGGDSSFGSLVVAKGGTAGNVNGSTATSLYGIDGGAGGAAGTGQVALVGAVGDTGYGAASLGTGGAGGPGAMGGGRGASRSSGTSGQSYVGNAAPANSGGGGGGALSTSTGGVATGGAGGSGLVVVVEWYAP